MDPQGMLQRLEKRKKLLVRETVDEFWKMKEKFPDLERNIYEVLDHANARDPKSAISDIELRISFQKLFGQPLPLAEEGTSLFTLFEYTNLMGGLASYECNSFEDVEAHTEEHKAHNCPRADSGSKTVTTQDNCKRKFYLISDDYP